MKGRLHRVTVCDLSDGVASTGFLPKSSVEYASPNGIFCDIAPVEPSPEAKSYALGGRAKVLAHTLSHASLEVRIGSKYVTLSRAHHDPSTTALPIERAFISSLFKDLLSRPPLSAYPCFSSPSSSKSASSTPHPPRSVPLIDGTPNSYLPFSVFRGSLLVY